MRVFVSRRDRRSALRWAAVLAVGLVVAYIAVRQYLPLLTDPMALRTRIEGFGVFAPLTFIALQTLQVVVAPIPGQVVVLAGGYLFGPVAGVTYSLVGATLGSAIVFWASRRYGRAYVERVVTPATLARFDGFTRDRTLTALFVAFLVPGLPDDVLCFVGGLTRVRLWKLVAVSLVGRIPSYLLVSVIGVKLASENVGTALALTVALGVLAAVSYRYRDRILDRLGG